MCLKQNSLRHVLAVNTISFVYILKKIIMDDSFYERKEHQTLLWLLKNSEFTEALVYLVCRRKYQNLKVINYIQSIEICNDELTLVILLSVGKVNREYLTIKNNQNLHFITFSDFFLDQSVLEDIYIKTINLKEWFNEILKYSKNEEFKRLYELSKLKIRTDGENFNC